jgi:hypothetical protein
MRPVQPGPPDPEFGPTRGAVYRRYRPGDPDPTPDFGGGCSAQVSGLACTWSAGHPSPQHVAGGAGRVLATWTGDGADLEVWSGEPDADPTPEFLGDLVETFDALTSALARCRPAAVGDLELLACLELPYSTVVWLPGESAREVATRHGLTMEKVTDPGTSFRAVTGYRFFGEAVRVAALLEEVARVRD